MDLITVKENNVVLSQNVIDALCTFETQIKILKEKQDIIKEEIKKEMEAKQIKGIKTDELTISYVEEFDTIKLDQKLLKEKYPDIVDECSKVSTTKSQVKFSFK